MSNRLKIIVSKHSAFIYDEIFTSFLIFLEKYAVYYHHLNTAEQEAAEALLVADVKSV